MGFHKVGIIFPHAADYVLCKVDEGRLPDSMEAERCGEIARSLILRVLHRREH